MFKQMFMAVIIYRKLKKVLLHHLYDVNKNCQHVNINQTKLITNCDLDRDSDPQSYSKRCVE